MSPDGTMRKLTEYAPLRSDEIYVPEDQEELVVNMNRQQRRAWARRQAEVNRSSK